MNPMLTFYKWENRQAETLTLEKLRRGIPESREEQRKLFVSQ